MQGTEDGGREQETKERAETLLTNAVRVSGLLEGNKDPLLRVAGIECA